MPIPHVAQSVADSDPSDGRIRLPVVCQHLPDHPRTPNPRRMARRRVWLMILIYVLIVAHVVQWRITGRTLGPFVASDTMETLENGVINGGFLIFAVVLLATLIFGRFICGWGCHMGGLQDLCAWLLRKVGIRPRILHARLLALIPIILGVYMFIWPTLKRDLIAPLLESWWPSALVYIGQYHDFPGWSARLSTTNIWERLPSLAVAIPFLLTCGFATVYFLGARGFCRFACPYGGIISPLEQLSPGRITVDASACDKCGKCTAACTSGIRVMEEVHAYGRIVSRHCTRTLDCIAVCPTKALKYRFAIPALFRGKPAAPKPRVFHDLSWPEELLVLGSFALAFFATRSLYEQIPMLMAGGLAACFAFIPWKAWRTLRDRDSRFSGFQLRRMGHIKPAGAVFILASLAVTGLIAHSAAVRIMLWRASVLEDPVTVTREVVFSGRKDLIPPEMSAAAEQSLRWYRAASAWNHGGWAIADTPSANVRAAWLHLVRAEYAPAEKLMRRAIDQTGTSDTLISDVALIMRLQGHPEQALRYLETIYAEHPDLRQVRTQLCQTYINANQPERAVALYKAALDADPDDAITRAQFASMQASLGRLDEALIQFRQAAADAPRNTAIRHSLAMTRYMTGDVDGALRELNQAADADPAARTALLQRGAEMLAEAGRIPEAEQWHQRAAAAQAGASAPKSVPGT